MTFKKIIIEFHADELDQKSKALISLLKTACSENRIILDKEIVYDGLDLLERFLKSPKSLKN